MGGFLNRSMFHPPPVVRAPDRVYRLGSGVVGLVKLPPPNAVVTGVIIYCHGNAVDLHDITGQMVQLSRTTSNVVVAVEYPGYGVSDADTSWSSSSAGRPTVKACTRATQVARDYVGKVYPGLPLTFVGQSIGSGFAAQVATNSDSLVLISPFKSVEAMVGEQVGTPAAWIVARGVLDTKAALAVRRRPTLIIHGDADTIIPFAHAQALNSVTELVCLRRAPGAGHNDLDWNLVCGSIDTFQRSIKKRHFSKRSTLSMDMERDDVLASDRFGL